MRLALLGLLAACGSVSGKKPDAAVGHDGNTTSDAAHDSAEGSGSGSNCTPKIGSIAGRWRAEGTPNDSVSNFVGTPVGNVTYAAGKHGMAFLFDGASYIHVDDGDTLWPPASFSVEMWINTTHSGTSMSLIEKYECWNYCPNGAANAYWALSLTGAGNPAFDERPDASGTIADVTDSLHALNDGHWHHIVGVKDTTGMKINLYVDGALAVSGNLTAAANGPMTNSDNETDPVVIAGSSTAGAATYTPTYFGAIDEAAFYTSALTAQQVADLYNAPDGECP